MHNENTYQHQGKSSFSLKGILLNIDTVSFFIILLLLTIGLTLVATVSPAIGERINVPSFYFIHKQLIFVAIFVPILLFFANISERAVKFFGLVGFFITLFLMMILPFCGYAAKGSVRWFSLWGFSIQPSEFFKPFYVVVTAMILTRNTEENCFKVTQLDRRLKDIESKNRAQIFISENILEHPYPEPHTHHAAQGKKSNGNDSSRKFLPCFVLHIIISTLLLLEPDLGMAITISFVTITQMFVAGLSWRWISITSAVFISCLVGAYLTLPHVEKRIGAFFGNDSTSYQVKKSLESYVNGGWLGTGPGEGKVKYSLPDSHTDFIFAVAGEEMGIIFCISIILIISYFIFRGTQNLLRLREPYLIYSGIGMLMYLAFQSLFNIGMTLRLFPAKGMTLPFMSYGGSSLLSFAIMMGIYLNVTKKTNTTWIHFKKPHVKLTVS